MLNLSDVGAQSVHTLQLPLWEGSHGYATALRVYVTPAVVEKETIGPFDVVAIFFPVASSTTTPAGHGDSKTQAVPRSLTSVTGPIVPSVLIEADTRKAPYARSVVNDAAPSE